MTIAAAAFAAAAGTAFALRRKLAAARAELAAERNRPVEPPPPRVVESRRERYSLLWFPTLTLKDEEKLVVSAAAGVPHCARCLRPLKLTPSSADAPEEWSCGDCGERRPASIADIMVTDSIVADTLQEFLARHDGWRALPPLSSKPQLPR